MKRTNFLLLTIIILLISVNPTFAQKNDVYTCVTDFMINEKPPRPGIRSAVSTRSNKWIPGQKLRVKFLDGDEFLQNKVKQYAEVWEQYGNIDFVWVRSGEAEIRISFGLDNGSWSFVGKASKISSYIKGANGREFVADDSGSSMNFGWFNRSTSEEEFRTTTLHEFGHALGLHHEHQNKNSKIEWNTEAVYQYFSTTMGWSKEKTKFNVLDRYDDDTEKTNGVYDRFSIMHYSYPPELIKGGIDLPRNTVLSDGDKKIIAEMYPFDNNVVVKDPTITKPDRPDNKTKTPVISFTDISVDFEAYNEKTDEEGMEFSTYFNVANGLNQNFSIGIYFSTADGKPLKDTNKRFYAIGGQVAVFRNFKPDYDNAVYRDFRVFIPYDEIDGLECGDNNLKFSLGIWNGNNRITSTGATYFTLTVPCED